MRPNPPKSPHDSMGPKGTEVYGGRRYAHRVATPPAVFVECNRH